MTVPAVQPQYLNLEYFFNQFFLLLKFLGQTFFRFFVMLQNQNFKIFSVFISVLLLACIVYVLYQMAYLKRSKAEVAVPVFQMPGNIADRTDKWKDIKIKMESTNPSDWKMAIIEADSLIDEIMKRTGHVGQDLGERLKSVEPSDFENLQNIWDAHKLRNRIAHQPDLQLSVREAKEAIGKYEKALKEFTYL